MIQQINENVVFAAPSVSQRAALHALRNRCQIQPEMVAEYKERMFYEAQRINQIPIERLDLFCEHVKGAVEKQAPLHSSAS